MRIAFAFLLLLSLPGWAESHLLELADWTANPQKVVKALEARNIEVDQKMFHKTGVPYIKAQLDELGNRWEATFYFDDSDRLNQILLQLDDCSRSQVTRVQKLAAGEFGPDFKTRTGEGETRVDTFFVWSQPPVEIELNSALYKSDDQSTVWLKLTPTR